ncbi:MAG: hypothetical protein GWP10_00270 [Nitrospiraceae bacterium]|nr:hypothetical protein [Nitrospiraceae bacterium]
MTNMIEFLGSGALNLDLIYEVEDLAEVRSTGLGLYAGREISGDQEGARDLIEFLDHHGVLRAKTGGGSSANTIYALSHLGHKTGFVGVVGADEAGAFILDSMQGVDLSYVKRIGRSAICIVIIEKERRNRAMFVAPHDHECDFLDPEALRNLSPRGILHLSSLASPYGIHAQTELLAAMGPEQVLSFDPGELYCAVGIEGLLPILERTGILFITREEIEILTDMAYMAGIEVIYPLLYKRPSNQMDPRLFRDVGGPAIVCKQGPEGASIYSPNNPLSYPAEEVPEVIDNTGAGDAFNAGLLHALSEGRSANACLKAGIWLAGLSLSGFGRNWLARLKS